MCSFIHFNIHNIIQTLCASRIKDDYLKIKPGFTVFNVHIIHNGLKRTILNNLILQQKIILMFLCNRNLLVKFCVADRG